MAPYHPQVDANNNSQTTFIPVERALPPAGGGLSPSASESLLALYKFCAFVPLRLSPLERSLLAVLESVLHVSEYTDQIDVATSRYSNMPGSVVRDSHLKIRKILSGILEACHLATGLGVCAGLDQYDHNNNNKSNEDEDEDDDEEVTSLRLGRDIQHNARFFQTLFEIGRRNKILNPTKMRDTYGKLMYLMQDAQGPTVTQQLGFSLFKDLEMVLPLLEKYEAIHIFQDQRLIQATRFIPTRDTLTGSRLSKAVTQDLLTQKKQCMYELLQEYSSGQDRNNNNVNNNTMMDDKEEETQNTHFNKRSKISKDNLLRCIESIADAISATESHVAIVQRMISLLEDHFDPQKPMKPFSLELRSSGASFSSSSFRTQDRFSYGFGAFGSYGSMSSSSSSGPTLSHSHSTQYTFVWQSLTLWSEVQRNMHRLWVCADEDLLSTTTSYELLNTGQGLNRVQACPRVARVMKSLLVATQKAAGSPWVGLSVVHLGDRDVPNALIFIDKYTQIPLFLKPIVDFVDGLKDLCNEHEAIGGYITREFDSWENLKMMVLSDYFKHGFDGSGGE